MGFAERDSGVLASLNALREMVVDVSRRLGDVESRVDVVLARQSPKFLDALGRRVTALEDAVARSGGRLVDVWWEAQPGLGVAQKLVGALGDRVKKFEENEHERHARINRLEQKVRDANVRILVLENRLAYGSSGGTWAGSVKDRRSGKDRRS